MRSEGYVRMQKELAESVLSNILTAFQQGMAGLTTLNYDQIDIKWHFTGDGNCRLPDSSAAAVADTYNYYLHLLLKSANTPASLVAQVSFYGTRTLTVAGDDGNGNTYPVGTVFTLSLRGLYDATTGSQTVVFDPVTNDKSIANQTTGQYQKVTTASGETSFVLASADTFNVAWGDANQGGVLAKGSEFGFLDKLDDGVSAHQKFLNLNDHPSLYTTTPPDSFQLRAYELVLWIVVFRTASPWAVGDRVYFTSESDGSNYKADGTGYTDYTYSLDFTNSAAAASGYTGDSGTYYQHSVFPLKTLRLDSTLSALNYAIRQQEQASETVTALDGSTTSVPTYQFWLEKPQTGTTMRTTPLSFAPWLGDLEVSNALHNKTFWVWDSTTKTRSGVASYVVSTTADLPPGFALPDTATATQLSTVETALGTLAAAELTSYP